MIVSVINGKGIKYKRNVDGKKLSLFKSGGTIDLVVLPKNNNELITILKLLKKYPTPYSILGNGSNTLIGDAGFSGIIILLHEFRDIVIKDNLVLAGSGVKLPYLAIQTANVGLKGFERLAGIPASIGGATLKNAGCFGHEIASIVKNVSCINLDTHEIIVLPRSNIEYSYHSSSSSFENLIITHTEFELSYTTDNLREIIKDTALMRKKLQPSSPSLGSVFSKTETGVSAGYYIDKVGLKGTKIGGAEISNKHANFIINTGCATSQDFISLAELAESMVKKKFNIILKREIDRIGED